MNTDSNSTSCYASTVAYSWHDSIFSEESNLDYPFVLPLDGKIVHHRISLTISVFKTKCYTTEPAEPQPTGETITNMYIVSLRERLLVMC